MSEIIIKESFVMMLFAIFLLVLLQYLIVVYGYYYAVIVKKQIIKWKEFNWFLLVPMALWINYFFDNKIEYQMPIKFSKNIYYLKTIIQICQNRINQLENNNE